MFARFLSNTRGVSPPSWPSLPSPSSRRSVWPSTTHGRMPPALRFQVSLDATALMLSKNAANEHSAALQTQATNTFNALYKHPK